MHTVCSDESPKHDLEKLSELYWPRLKKYFHGQGFSDADAEDLTQETLKEMSRCIARFDASKGSLDNYVLRERTSRLQAVRPWHERWKIEQGYQQMKEELGLDHFEGRS